MNDCKRKATHISPTSNCNKKVNMDNTTEGGLCTLEQVKKAMTPMFENLVTKSDLASLVTRIHQLESDNGELHLNIKQLSEKCCNLERQLDQFHMWRHEKNIIVRMDKGPDIKAEENRTSEICEQLTGNKDILEGGNIKTLSTKDPKKCLLMVSLKSASSVQNIMRNANKLKGSDITISKDYPMTIRRKRGYLLRVRKFILIKSNSRLTLRDDFLFDDNVKMFWDLEKGLYTSTGQNINSILEKYGTCAQELNSFLNGERQQSSRTSTVNTTNVPFSVPSYSSNTGTVN